MRVWITDLFLMNLNFESCWRPIEASLSYGGVYSACHIILSKPITYVLTKSG